MDETRACYTEWSKSKREKQVSYINANTWNLEKCYWWTYLQGRNKERTGLWTQQGKQKVGWIKRVALKHLHYLCKIDSQRGQTDCSPGESFCGSSDFRWWAGLGWCYDPSNSTVLWFYDVTEERRIGSWARLQLRQFLRPLDSDSFGDEGRWAESQLRLPSSHLSPHHIYGEKLTRVSPHHQNKPSIFYEADQKNNNKNILLFFCF